MTDEEREELTRRGYRHRTGARRVVVVGSDTPGEGSGFAVPVEAPVWIPVASLEVGRPPRHVDQEEEEDAPEEYDWASEESDTDEPDENESVELDDELPPVPPFFVRMRQILADVLARVQEKIPALGRKAEPADEEEEPEDDEPEAPEQDDDQSFGLEFVDGGPAAAQSLDFSDFDSPMTTQEVADAAASVDLDDDTPGEKLTAKERRALKKEFAAAARQAKSGEGQGNAKSLKAEKKRQAIEAKEAKALEKKRKRAAIDEERLERDEVRSRARREKRAAAEYAKKQKRRELIRANGGKVGFWQGTSKPKPMDITNAIRSLAIILESSPAEIDAIKMMAEEFAGNAIGDAFDRVYDRLVKDNMTLVAAFESEDLFPAVVHNMLKVGSRTARPGPALRTAVDLMGSSNDNSRAMRNALMEPLMVTVLSLAVLFGVAWFVMPVFVDMYNDLELEIGMFTQITLVFSDVAKWTLICMAIAAAFITVWWFAFGRSDLRVRVALDRFKLTAPLTGKGEQANQVFQMFNTLDAYLAVGSSERESLINTANAIENRAIKRQLRMTANGLTRGEKTFAQFLDDPMFPRLAVSILATGQRSGQTGQVVKNLRAIYENEARVEGKQSVEKVVGVFTAITSLLFSTTSIIVTVPPLEIFGATLSYSG